MKKYALHITVVYESKIKIIETMSLPFISRDAAEKALEKMHRKRGCFVSGATIEDFEHAEN